MFQFFNTIDIKYIILVYYQFIHLKILTLLILNSNIFLLSNLFNDFINNIPIEKYSFNKILNKVLIKYKEII